jgi:predicted SAM-dependent methyltransferase
VQQKKIAIDLNPDAANFLDKDVEFHNINAFKIGERFSNLDVIITANFLEHLLDKRELDAFLLLALNTLKPGGKLLIVGPTAICSWKVLGLL